MFKVIKKTDRYVFWGTKHKLAIMPISTFERGRKRMAKRAKIRKPVHAVIDREKYKQEKENARASLMQEKQRTVFGDWLESLKNRANVERLSL